jgi:hypothetical protein
LWLIKVWFSASTFVVKIATFAKPENVSSNGKKIRLEISASIMKFLFTLVIVLLATEISFGQYEYNSKEIIKLNRVMTEKRVEISDKFDNIERFNFSIYVYDSIGNVTSMIYSTKYDSIFDNRQVFYSYNKENQVMKIVYIKNMKDSTTTNYEPNDPNKSYKPLYIDYGAERVYLNNKLLKEEKIGKTLRYEYQYEYYK